jgi:Rrf2 family protein
MVDTSMSQRRDNRSGANSEACSGERSSLMNIGRRVDYAVRALAYLAGQEEERLVPCAEIEARQGIPRHFLSKILRCLVEAGYLDSVAGARGGFRMRRSAASISLREVYECFEGELCLIECLRDQGGACNYTAVCTQIDVWRGARQKLFEYLESVTIAQVADPAGLEPRRAQGEQSSPALPAVATGAAKAGAGRL